MALFTAGYEGVDIDTFLDRLRAAGIDKILDVRQFPISRKKGFSKTAFSERLRESGIGYEHIKALGCPKPIRDQYKQDGDWKLYSKGFRAYVQTQPQALAQVIDEASKQDVCLLCFEADATFCHRRLVAEAGKSLEPQMAVKHLAVRKARLAAV